jgi:hypothetical protein
MRPVLYLLLGSVLIASPIMAYERLCPNARPGCGGNCHGDEEVQKCPKAKVDQGLELFFGQEGLKVSSLNK